MTSVAHFGFWLPGNNTWGICYGDISRRFFCAWFCVWFWQADRRCEKRCSKYRHCRPLLCGNHGVLGKWGLLGFPRNALFLKTAAKAGAVTLKPPPTLNPPRGHPLCPGKGGVTMERKQPMLDWTVKSLVLWLLMVWWRKAVIYFFRRFQMYLFRNWLSSFH